MPDKDWSKYKTGGTQTGQTPVGTLQTQEIQPKKDWSKYKTVSPEKPEEIAGQKVKFTKTGHIDTRYFYETPKWVLKFNKAVDEKITKQFKELDPSIPRSVLMGIMDIFSRAHPYEVMRDIIVEPEKYPTLASKALHYLETVISPKVSPSLRGYSELTRGFTEEYGELYPLSIPSKIFPESVAKFIKGMVPGFTQPKETLTEEERKAQYEKRVLGEGLPQTAFKVGDKVVDVGKLLGFGGDVWLDPTNWALMGAGGLGKTVIGAVARKTPTISKLIALNMEKNLALSAMSRITAKGATAGVEGLTGQAVLKNFIKNADSVEEGTRMFLNSVSSGWQSVVLQIAGEGKELPKYLTWVDDLMNKLSKTPIGAKRIERLSRNFTRGYKDNLVQDFESVMRALKIKPGSGEEQLIGDYIDTSFALTGKSTAFLAKKKFYTEKLAKIELGMTPEVYRAIDYFEKVNEMMEYIEKSKIFGFDFDYKHIRHYLHSQYINTGEKKAFPLYELSKRIKTKHGPTKPIFTFEKQFASTEDAIKAGYEIATPFERMKLRLGIHAKATNYSTFLTTMVSEYGSTSKLAGYRTVKISPKKFYPQLKKVYFSDEIASFLERGNEIIQLGGFTKNMLKVMTPITRAYKTIWTFTTGFNLRNLIGSHGQNFLYFGTKTLSPKLQKLIAKLAWTVDDFDILINGKTVKASTFRDIFDLSGISAGWYRGEITDLPSALGVFKPMRLLGETVERDARMFAFYSALNKGDDLLDAILTTKLLHFDYLDGLSQAEKVYMRTFIPFYSWYRFNTPLQLRFMIENPQRVASIFKVWRSLGIGTPDETPEWFDNYMMGKIGDLDASNNIQKYLRIDLPIAQIGLLQPSYEALTRDKDLPLTERWKKFISPFVGLSHPLIKSIVELTSNFDTFREKTVPTKVVSPMPTVMMDALPEYVKNWFGAEEKISGTGFRVYHVDGMKAKILENIIPLYHANILTGYEKYEGYAEQKLNLDKISFYLGVKLYPVDLNYLQGKYKQPIKKVPTKKTDWKKYKTERGK